MSKKTLSATISLDRERVETHLRGLSKVRCWMTGFHAGRGTPTSALGGGIPGEEALRFLEIMLRDALAADAPLTNPPK